MRYALYLSFCLSKASQSIVNSCLIVCSSQYTLWCRMVWRLEASIRLRQHIRRRAVIGLLVKEDKIRAFVMIALFVDDEESERVIRFMGYEIVGEVESESGNEFWRPEECWRRA